MSKWKKSSEELVDQFHRAIEEIEGIQRRKMFGYPCAFLEGNMVTGLHEENWILRLDEESREEMKREWNAAPFEPMAGRIMKQYLILPRSIYSDPDLLAHWLQRSLQYVVTLPPKKSK